MHIDSSGNILATSIISPTSGSCWFNQTNVPLGPQLTPSCKIPHQIKAKVFFTTGDTKLIFCHSRPEKRASQKKLVALKIGTLTLAKVRASDRVTKITHKKSNIQIGKLRGHQTSRLTKIATKSDNLTLLLTETKMFAIITKRQGVQRDRGTKKVPEEYKEVKNHETFLSFPCVIHTLSVPIKRSSCTHNSRQPDYMEAYSAA